MKIGLMGCGTVARYGHLPAIAQTPEWDLHAVYDPNFASADSAREKFGAAHAFDDAELFFQSGLDAITITSPAPAHLQNVLDAARHGLPVLCEKPLATQDSDAAQMIAAMQAAGVPLFTGFCYRFSPAALRIKQLIEAGEIGEVRAARLIYIWNLHGKWTRDTDGNRIENERRIGRMDEGGPLIDCGVHQIDLARWWLNSEVVSQHAVGAWVEDFEVPDHIWLHMGHQNGAQTCVEISYSYTATCAEPKSQFVYELIGTDGLIHYDRNAKTFEMRNSKGTQSLEWSQEKEFAGMYGAFALALQTGENGHLPTGEDGLRAIQIARSATEEAIKNQSK